MVTIRDIVLYYNLLTQCISLSFTVVVVHLAPNVVSQELNNTLHSTITGGSVAFSGENVTFTCVVRGSNAMEWTSEQYIGTGGRRLEFISADPVGTTRTSGEAIGELISATVDEIIISRLSVKIPQPTFSFASVQCHNINAGTMFLNTFQLAGMYIIILLLYYTRRVPQIIEGAFTDSSDSYLYKCKYR